MVLIANEIKWVITCHKLDKREKVYLLSIIMYVLYERDKRLPGDNMRPYIVYKVCL